MILHSAILSPTVYIETDLKLLFPLRNYSPHTPPADSTGLDYLPLHDRERGFGYSGDVENGGEECKQQKAAVVWTVTFFQLSEFFCLFSTMLISLIAHREDSMCLRNKLYRNTFLKRNAKFLTKYEPSMARVYIKLTNSIRLLSFGVDMFCFVRRVTHVRKHSQVCGSLSFRHQTCCSGEISVGCMHF